MEGLNATPPTTTDWCTLEHACTGGGVGGQHVWSLVDCEQGSGVEISRLIEVTLMINSFFWEHFPSPTAGVCERPHTPCAALLLT